jgi:hypothetical protein
MELKLSVVLVSEYVLLISLLFFLFINSLICFIKGNLCNKANLNNLQLVNYVDRCYGCQSSSLLNCADGSKLTDKDSIKCPPGRTHCQKTTSLGIVQRLCSINCVPFVGNGLETKCCTTNNCNDDRLDSEYPQVAVNRCYSCNSLTSPQCSNGFMLSGIDTVRCPTGTNFCSVCL